MASHVNRQKRMNTLMQLETQNFTADTQKSVEFDSSEPSIIRRITLDFFYQLGQARNRISTSLPQPQQKLGCLGCRRPSVGAGNGI